MKRPRVAIVLAVLTAALTACQLLVGIGSGDDPPSADAAARVDPALADANADTSRADAGVADAALVCRTGLTACGAECVDTRASRAHCGACGHGCLGAECLAGECELELVAPDSRGGAVYVAGEEILYGSGDDASPSRLVARNVASGTVRDVTDVGAYFTMVHIAGTEWVVTDNPYVGGPARARVRVVDVVTGATVRTLYSGPFTPNVRSATVRGDDVYFGTRADLRHVKASGGTVAIVNVGTPTQALFVGDGTVYFGIEDGQDLLALPRDGGGSTVIDRAPTDDTASAAFIAEAPGLVRWLIGGELRDVPLDGAAPAVHSLPIAAPHSVAASGSHVFVADDKFGDDQGSRVFRVDVVTHEVLVLASRKPPYGQVATDARYVYLPRYANFGGGVFRVAK